MRGEFEEQSDLWNWLDDDFICKDRRIQKQNKSEKRTVLWSSGKGCPGGATETYPHTQYRASGLVQKLALRGG